MLVSKRNEEALLSAQKMHKAHLIEKKKMVRFEVEDRISKRKNM